ncbi:MAG: STAS domain-containing protein [Actinobacteria bacterium]|nr:MAG: STAS domain-containing protein [Actinomycetota bacterium]
MGNVMPLADLELESISGLPVAHLFGEIDRSNAAELGDRVASAIGDQSGGLVVDLSELAFLDSTGIRMLFGLAAQLNQRHQKLRVVVPDGSHLGEILDTVGLQQAAATDHTVGEAVAALTRTG